MEVAGEALIIWAPAEPTAPSLPSTLLPLARPIYSSELCLCPGWLWPLPGGSLPATAQLQDLLSPGKLRERRAQVVSLVPRSSRPGEPNCRLTLGATGTAVPPPLLPPRLGMACALWDCCPQKVSSSLFSGLSNIISAWPQHPHLLHLPQYPPPSQQLTFLPLCLSHVQREPTLETPRTCPTPHYPTSYLLRPIRS